MNGLVPNRLEVGGSIGAAAVSNSGLSRPCRILEAAVAAMYPALRFCLPRDSRSEELLVNIRPRRSCPWGDGRQAPSFRSFDGVLIGMLLVTGGTVLPVTSFSLLGTPKQEITADVMTFLCNGTFVDLSASGDGATVSTFDCYINQIQCIRIIHTL